MKTKSRFYTLSTWLTTRQLLLLPPDPYKNQQTSETRARHQQKIATKKDWREIDSYPEIAKMPSWRSTHLGLIGRRKRKNIPSKSSGRRLP